MANLTTSPSHHTPPHHTPPHHLTTTPSHHNTTLPLTITTKKY
ncbi:MAG: hypothetical protein SPE60_02425 [Prevotella sp.]|nr:hypothetical protein [Prevotella sp.]MDY4441803.1 hypothetical protein [Prevotella sp.]